MIQIYFVGSQFTEKKNDQKFVNFSKQFFFWIQKLQLNYTKNK